MNTNEREPVVLFLPGFEYPQGIAEEQPHGNYAGVVEEFEKEGVDIRLVHPDWANIPKEPISEGDEEAGYEVEYFDVLDRWRYLVDKAIKGVRAEGRDLILAGHSIGGLEAYRYAALPLNGLLGEDTPLRALLLFSPSPFSGEARDLFMQFLEQQAYPTDYRDFSEGLVTGLSDSLRTMQERGVPVHVTCGAGELPLNNIQAWQLAGLGRESTNTFGTVPGAGHNIVAYPEYARAAAHLARIVIDDTVYVERPPIKNGFKVELRAPVGRAGDTYPIMY